jgi:hypothetical protein
MVRRLFLTFPTSSQAARAVAELSRGKPMDADRRSARHCDFAMDRELELPGLKRCHEGVSERARGYLERHESRLRPVLSIGSRDPDGRV